MQGFQILLILIGLFLTIAGFLNFNEVYVKKSINYFSELKGLKPMVTKNTLKMARIQGWFFVFLGIGLVVFGLLFCYLLPIACIL